ncbi:MAG: hypothetical protein ABSD74_00870 [Rhizomicrobium sp.]
MNAVLVFDGLLVAGVMTLAASDSLHAARGFSACLAAISAVAAMISGICALLSMMFTVDYARSLELNKPEGEISTNRRKAIFLSRSSFWSACAATAVACFLVIAVLGWR